MAMYMPVSVANGFLELSFRDGIAVDPMKAQKLLYFSQGYYLALKNAPLLNERFQAWKFGPVLPTIYHRLKGYGAAPITSYAEVYDPALGRSHPAAPPEQDADFLRVRDFVWETYGRWESTALSRLTHNEGDAWDRTRKQNPGIEGPQISDDDILRDFRPLVPQAAEPVGG